MIAQGSAARSLATGALLAIAGLGCRGGQESAPTSPAADAAHPADAAVTRDAPARFLDASDDVAPTIPNDAGQLVVFDQSARIGVTVPADGIVDEAGNAPALPVSIRLQRFRINRYEDMPGGWRAVDAAGKPVAHATAGVIQLVVEGRDGRRLMMRPGRVFRLYFIYNFTGPPAVLHLDEPASLWREEGRILPDNTSNSIEVEVGPFGLFSLGKIAAPLCRTGLLKNLCGEVIPNASVVGFAVYYDLRFAEAATSDAAGRISFQAGFPEPNTWIDARVTFGGRTLRVPMRVDNQPGTCARDGDLTVPTCDGVECYSEGGVTGGGNCNPPRLTCPLSWEVEGGGHCTDGHLYRWGCGGEAPACGCACFRDGTQVFTCSNQPVACGANLYPQPGLLCISGPATCGFPRYVSKRSPPRRPCDSDADCIAILPHCLDRFCSR